MKRILSAFAFFIVMLTASAQPQPAGDRQPILLGISDRIQSAILGESRTVNLYFPPSYDPASERALPVIYLLDGGESEDFIHIAGLVQFMSTIADTIPQCIVVGIANVDRRRDFTYPTTVAADKKDNPTSGGSDKFISFIEKELQPYIKKRYHTGDYRTLVGQSLGGLLATEILLKKPNLFNAYLIVSPSLWWDGESLLAKAPALLAGQTDTDRRIYIAVGSEGKQMEDDAHRLADILHASGLKHLSTDLMSLPDENHRTILHQAAYKGFEDLFQKK